jgi:Serine protease inhibitor
MNPLPRRRLVITLILFFAAVLLACSLFSFLPNFIKAKKISNHATFTMVEEKKPDDKFIANTADFSVKLFQKSITKEENSLISPISVQLALAMTANGADGETLTQMETLLGGDIPLSELNRYLYTYVKNLPDNKNARLKIANSIWFRDDKDNLKVEQDFLKTNANYYGADIYKASFEEETVKDINRWTKEKTDGKIKKILESIDPDNIMFLINAITFDAKWETVYTKDEIEKSEFTTYDGSSQNVDFMYSEEGSYLEDDNATGFIKPYAGNKYSYVALLPKKSKGINDYINQLTGESFISILKNVENTSVGVSQPKFSYEYSVKMNDVLKQLGMPEAFSDDADFNKLGTSRFGNIYISEVLHKTFISVDERGTKAGAATKVVMNAKSAGPSYSKHVTLDRPYVYAIIDNATNLPIFIGTVMSVND